MSRHASFVAPLAIAAALVFSAPARAVDPCIECGQVYASDTSGFFYRIDPATGVATLIGTHDHPIYGVVTMLDIGITSDARLFGIATIAEGDIDLIDACTGAASTYMGNAYGNGMTGDPLSTDLFIQGPPLGRVGTLVPTLVFVGGNTDGGGGEGMPPLWCGPSSGDLASSPSDGLLYSTLQCPSCPGDKLVRIDPLTGDVLSEAGCIVDADSGAGYQVFGLAFDDECRLLGSTLFDSFLLVIDPETGAATQLPITGGFAGAFGLASLRCPDAPPCPTVGQETCEPLTQGFWKRQCRRPHPSGEHERLGGYASCAGATATFAGTATAEQVCAALNPTPPNDKCLQAEAQFMALLLNVCSGRLGRSCCIDTPETEATTVGEAIEEIDALLASATRTFRDCVRAQAIADAINTSAALCETSSSRIAPLRSPEPPRSSPFGLFKNGR